MSEQSIQANHGQSHHTCSESRSRLEHVTQNMYGDQKQY